MRLAGNPCFSRNDSKMGTKLKEISDGAFLPKNFMEQTNKMVYHLVSSSSRHSANWVFSEDMRENFTPSKKMTKSKGGTSLGNCKKCDGSVVDKGSFYGCSNYQKNQCNFTISKKILGKNITQKNIKLLLSEGKQS